MRGAAEADPDARAQWEESQAQCLHAARVLVGNLLAVDRTLRERLLDEEPPRPDPGS